MTGCSIYTMNPCDELMIAKKDLKEAKSYYQVKMKVAHEKGTITMGMLKADSRLKNAKERVKNLEAIVTENCK